MKKPAVFLLLFLVSMSLVNLQAGNYRTPAEMNPDDWDMINEAQSDYLECLELKMIEFGENSDDPRIISDQVLDVCSVILIKLDRDMGERNINPYFTQRYIYNMKNKAAQQMLRNLMMMIASRQQMIDTSKPENANEIKE